MEFALLADGVARDAIYTTLGTKAGVDRAFRKLDQIKPHVSIWWDSGAQAVQAVVDADLFYTPMFNGRLQKMTESGVPVKLVWNGAARHITYHGIPKGSKNIAEAHAYLNRRATRGDLAVQYAKFVPYPISISSAYDNVSEELKAALPTTPPKPEMMFTANDEFWATPAGEAIRERFNTWLLT